MQITYLLVFLFVRYFHSKKQKVHAHFPSVFFYGTEPNGSEVVGLYPQTARVVTRRKRDAPSLPAVSRTLKIRGRSSSSSRGRIARRRRKRTDAATTAPTANRTKTRPLGTRTSSRRPSSRVRRKHAREKSPPRDSSRSRRRRSGATQR